MRRYFSAFFVFARAHYFNRPLTTFPKTFSRLLMSAGNFETATFLKNTSFSLDFLSIQIHRRHNRAPLLTSRSKNSLFRSNFSRAADLMRRVGPRRRRYKCGTGPTQNASTRDCLSESAHRESEFDWQTPGNYIITFDTTSPCH